MNMAGRGSSRVRSSTFSRRFMKVLVSAFFEWLLIVMLFIHATLAYLITTFARYCELPIPCLLCSRLDHLLGNGRPGLYWDLMCGKHKLEISSLVLCNLHDKLIDVHGICERCLFSFATKDKSNSEKYRLLVGKLGTCPTIDVVDSPLSDDDLNPTSTAGKFCCCCKNPWTSRGHIPFLLQPKPTKMENTVLDAPLTREIKPHVDAGNRTKRPYQFDPSSFEQGNVNDPLIQFLYCELKISSDTESDILISDAEELKTLEHETHSSPKYHNVNVAQVFTQNTTVVDQSFSRIHVDWEQIVDVAQVDTQNTMVLDESVSRMHIDLDQIVDVAQVDTRNTKIVDESVSGIHDDLDQIADVAQVDTQSTKVIDDSFSGIHIDRNQIVDVVQVDTQNTKILDQSISGIQIDLDEPLKLMDETQFEWVDMYEAPSVTPATIGHGLEEISWQQIELQVEPSSSLELINANDVPEPLDNTDKSLYFKGIIQEQEKIPVDEIKKEIDESQVVHITSDLKDSKVNIDETDGSMSSPNGLDLGSAYKLAIGSKGRQLSGKLVEQLVVKDSTRASEDLKLLLTHLSAARGLDSPVSAKVSPRISGNLEGLRISDSSASAGLQILQSRISLDRNDSRNSLDRNESGFESVTFSIVSEIEGENELDRSKRQIEHDKKVLSCLLKELEEERNASAEAANQAMAMINKLQEEKATLQMEALHDIRMMEEQAEYDMNALEAANDLLAEKDKEIQDLEAELDYYRIKYPEERDFDNGEDNPASGHDKASYSSRNQIDSTERTCESAIDHNNSISKSTLCLDFEDEKTYISRCLSDMEKKLHLFSDYSAYSDPNDQSHHETVEKRLAESEEGSKPMDEVKDGSEVRKDNADVSSISIRNHSVRPAHSLEDPKYDRKGGETDLVALCYKVTSLSDRLHALEMDSKLLEHTINSLRNGEEGFCFIQEIASHLRELRSMAIKRNQA